MTGIPSRPKIFHITHVDNLARIVESGRIWSDAKRIGLGLDCEVVGMSEIKRRRLEELEVSCHPGTRVGEYVPFYFCPRSIMLYILHRGNHPEITYRDGQYPIIHLQADLFETVSRADKSGVRWAFSDVNAGARYANFFSDLTQLDKVNWKAVHGTDFRDPLVKDGKQAEFLVFEYFPWNMVEMVGVMDENMADRVSRVIKTSGHRPLVNIKRMWYY